MKARPMRMFAAVAGIGIALGAFAPACGGAVSTLCSKVCDCEHCNDYNDDVVCDVLDGEEKIAKDYGCDSQFGDWIDCQNNSGTCNDEKATFSSRAPGHCGGLQNTEQPCKTDADCNQGDTFCQNATCQFKICDGPMGNQQQCKVDGDCTGGTDLCATQATAFESCVTNASTDKTIQLNLGGN